MTSRAVRVVRGGWLVALALSTSAVLVACSSSAAKTDPSFPAASASVALPSAAVSSSSLVTSSSAQTSSRPAVRSSTASTATTAATTAQATRTVATPVPPSVSPSTCSKVTVRVLPGGAAPGTEIAALQFTNADTKPCALAGFPSVRLYAGAHLIGSPSQPDGQAARTMTLKPGDTAESLLRDYSNCQAPLSDTAQVTVPGESTTVQRPVRLRACALRVAPLAPPA